MDIQMNEPEIKNIEINSSPEIKKEDEQIKQVVEEQPKPKKRAPAKKKEPSQQYIELKNKVEAKKKKEPKPKKEKIKQPTKNNFYLQEEPQQYYTEPNFIQGIKSHMRSADQSAYSDTLYAEPHEEYYIEPELEYNEPEIEYEEPINYPPQPLYQIPKKSVKYEDEEYYSPPRRATKYELNELYEKPKIISDNPYSYVEPQKETKKVNKVLKSTTGSLINLLDEYKPTKRVNIFRN